MPLTASETEEADDLILALSFDEGVRKEEAQVALARWAGTDADRLAYIKGHDVVEDSLQSNLAELRTLYSRPTLHSLEPGPRAQSVKNRPARRYGYRAMAMAASAVAIAAVAVSINPALSTQVVKTEVGGRLHVAMGDGTQLLLNTDTALEIQNRLRSRDIELKRGEAMFSVVHRDGRPFHVHAGDLDIEDTGTRFAVRNDSQRTAVTVAEGTVSVFSDKTGASLQISSNEGVTFDRKHGFVPMPRTEAGHALDWTQHRIEFTMLPLDKLVAEIQRYRSRPIVFADGKARTYPVTGSFSNEDPDHLLKMLADVAPVTVRFDAQGQAVISSATNY